MMVQTRTQEEQDILSVTLSSWQECVQPSFSGYLIKKKKKVQEVTVPDVYIEKSSSSTDGSENPRFKSY